MNNEILNTTAIPTDAAPISKSSIKPTRLIPIPSYGVHMTMDEFIGLINYNVLTPDDGHGCWATDMVMDDNSNVFVLQKPNWATHVVWFNR